MRHRVAKEMVDDFCRQEDLFRPCLLFDQTSQHANIYSLFQLIVDANV